jgi:hypothetical protein
MHCSSWPFDFFIPFSVSNRLYFSVLRHQFFVSSLFLGILWEICYCRIETSWLVANSPAVVESLGLAFPCIPGAGLFPLLGPSRLLSSSRCLGVTSVLITCLHLMFSSCICWFVGLISHAHVVISISTGSFSIRFDLNGFISIGFMLCMFSRHFTTRCCLHFILRVGFLLLAWYLS